MADFDVEDISQLERLDDDSIRKTLKTRYAKDKIYTNCGDMLIAVNPFKNIPIFGKKQHEEYDWKAPQRVLPPHVFYMAARAYRRMHETGTNQVILVGGESGAGKTETTKYIVKHLVSMCSEETSDLHQRIVKINPLLEVFGNAKTTLNENSSRFAKYLEMTFSSDGKVTGAIVRDYLLEKSRVVNQMDQEGNFHMFYCLFAGAPKAMLKHLRLDDPGKYRILKQNRHLLQRTELYRDMYNEQIEVLKSINMDPQDMDIIHTVLAAVLHITQVEFVKHDDPNEPLQIRDCSVVKHVADLLNVSYEDLGHALISTKQTFAGETIVKRKSMSQAIDSRDALAKSLYERLFGWIVFQINKSLNPSKSRAASRACASIGILDIAGFENLESNSLEQLCINFINEKLQNFANKNIVDFEMSVYKAEGFQLADISFKNNDAVLELFMKKPFGILPLLDEESKLGQGTNKRLISNLNGRFDRHESYTASPHGRTEFGVKHFAGQVWYDGSMFIEKNRDLMSSDITTCMKESDNPFVSDLFTIRKGPTGTISGTVHNIRKSKKALNGGPSKPISREGQQLLVDLGTSLKQRFSIIEESSSLVYSPKDQKTVISYFQTSMKELLSKLGQAEPYFVRCIKPNMFLKPNNFDEEKVAEQILYNGISEVAKIRQLGLPVRKRYDDFRKRYRPICLECRKSPSPRAATDLILQQVLPVYMRLGVKFGKSRIFMKEEVYIWLEKCRSNREKAAADIIAKRWQGYVHVLRSNKEKAKNQLMRELDDIQREDENKDVFETTQSHSVRSDATGQSYARESWSSNSASDSEDDDEKDQMNTSYSPINAKSLANSLNPQMTKRKRRAPMPPDTKSIPTRPAESEAEEQGSKPSRKAHKEFWDIFKIITREPKRDDFHTTGVMKVLKVVTYLVLALLLLSCCVIQKLSLAIHVSHTSGFHDTLLLIVMCIPYVLLFLISMWRTLFGNVPLPSKKNAIFVIIIEGLHSVGLSLLAFRVLPEIDVVRGIMLLSCTCIMPSILKPMCSSSQTTNKSTVRKISVFIFDILASILQMSAVPIVVLTEYYINTSHLAENNMKILEAIAALFLCSFSYWENFVDDRFCGTLSNTNTLHRLVLALKFDLQESRPIVYVLAAPVKALVTGLVAFNLNELETQLGWNKFLNDFELLGKEPNLLTAISFTLALALSAFIGHFLAYTACKLQMQIFSFAVPLLLSTPVAVFVLYIDCRTQFLLEISYENRSCDADLLNTWWQLPVAAGWLISVYWIGRHIWFPRQPRLAKLENLFVNPLYCGILMEQDLILNRRRHTRKIYKTNREERISYSLAPESVRDVSPDDEVTADTIPPMVYACGTLWHESRQEMVQLLKSLFRMDKDQYLRKKAVNMFGVEQADVKYYEFEPHIFFDDAFETNDDSQSVPNSFVNLFIELMEEAASSVHEKAISISDPIKIPTPYGGQLVYLMPGENFMFVHLKDKNKVRHKKRWSQVMYMYYLLGYRILKECQELVMTAMKDNAYNNLVSWRHFEGTGKVEKSQIFSFLDEEVLYRAQNTFILALDGDVEFTPGSVHLLIDKLKKNDRVGAVCGRIHPTGKGPIVWFQQFEYAIAHWLQKATEHVFGCVLCSPGCFSMFRGSSLMDDNVMRKFTILPTDASHHLMYDQGEDRWLCTLLLQQGYRIDYTAASDVFTHVPEDFGEFFDQRKRWMPSTIANTLEVLQDARNTVAINNSISWIYIIYQYILLLSTLIGPGLVVMMVAGALVSVFSVEIITSYAIALVPVVLFIMLCFFVNQKNQIRAAQILAAWFIFIMAVVFVGCIIIAVKENPLHPSVIFIETLILIFIVTACFHPHEFSCILHGTMFYLCIPLGFLLVVIYSLCNMHDISWGTREVQKKKTLQEKEEEERLKKERKESKQQGFLARFIPKMHFADLAEVLKGLQMKNKRKEATAELLRVMNKNFELLLKLKQNKGRKTDIAVEDIESMPEQDFQNDLHHPVLKKAVKFDDYVIMQDDTKGDETVAPKKKDLDDITNPRWAKQKQIGSGPLLQMNPSEAEFWKNLIHRYLYPLEVTAASQKLMKTRLLELRNSVCVGIGIINLIWIAVNFMFQLRKPAIIYFSVPSDVDETDVNTETFQVDLLGMLFIIFFGVIILIQFIGMLVHRWGTFLHLIAITELSNPFKRTVRENDTEKENSKVLAQKALEFCERLNSESIQDDTINSDDDEEDENAFRAMAEVLENIQEKGTKYIPGSTNPFSISIRQTGLNASYNGGRSQLGRTSGANPLMKSILRRTARKDSNILDLNDNQVKASRRDKADVNDIEKGNPKLRFEVGAPLKRHFLSEIRNRKLPNTPEDFLKKDRLSQTLKRGGYDEDTFANSEEDTDPMYDTVPGLGAMDKAFVKKFKKFRHQEKQQQVNGWSPQRMSTTSNFKNSTFNDQSWSDL